ncbi:7653_t:CDS:2, partial [Racocetra persica]
QKKEKPALFCKLCESAKLNNNFITSCFTNQLGTSHLSVIRNLVNTYWLVKNLVATSKITDLTSLTKYHVKCIEEIYTPVEIYTLDYLLFELLEESHADYGSYSNKYESTTVIMDKNLVIISKHISKNLLVYHYLGMIELKEGTADAIVNELSIFIQAKNLPIDRLMNIGSDKHNNGVVAQFKKKNPYLIKHHCISYRLALASENTASAVLYLAEYNDIVQSLYNYFIIQALQEDYKILKTASMLFDMIDQKFLLTTSFLADILSDLQQDLLTSNIPPHIQQFAQATIENLQAHFPDHETTNVFYIFDLYNLPRTILPTEYRNKEIALIANFYGT